MQCVGRGIAYSAVSQATGGKSSIHYTSSDERRLSKKKRMHTQRDGLGTHRIRVQNTNNMATMAKMA